MSLFGTFTEVDDFVDCLVNATEPRVRAASGLFVSGQQTLYQDKLDFLYWVMGEPGRRRRRAPAWVRQNPNFWRGAPGDRIDWQAALECIIVNQLTDALVGIAAGAAGRYSARVLQRSVLIGPAL